MQLPHMFKGRYKSTVFLVKILVVSVFKSCISQWVIESKICIQELKRKKEKENILQTISFSIFWKWVKDQ